MSTMLIKPIQHNYLPSAEGHAFDWLANFKTALHCETLGGGRSN
jgi:hypothetical protein